MLITATARVVKLWNLFNLLLDPHIVLSTEQVHFRGIKPACLSCIPEGFSPRFGPTVGFRFAVSVPF
jgi:hypothetical protein